MPLPLSYGDAIAFRAYHEARGNAIELDITNEDIDKMLLVASEWLDGFYFSQFTGLKTGGRDQVREWPRTGVNDVYGYYIPSDIPPREIIEATFIAAYKELVTPGVLNKDYTPPKYKRVKVEGAVEAEYAGFANSSDVQTQFPGINALLYAILGGSSAGAISSLSGAISRV